MRIRATVTLKNEAMIAARERLSLTQKQVADRACVGQAYISCLECLKYPATLQYDRVLSIADVLGLDIDEIFPEKMKGWRGQTNFHTTTEISCEKLMDAAQRRNDRYILPDPSDTIETIDEIENIKKLVSLLPPRRAQVLTLRYGLGKDKPLNSRDTAKRLGTAISNITISVVCSYIYAS